MNEKAVPLKNLDKVYEKLDWMEKEKIWPNGLRYLWTDAFGLVLYVSLYNETQDKKYIEKAERLISEVKRVLGRKSGIRIGEESDRDGQYFHYLIMWVYALWRFGKIEKKYDGEAVELVKQIHNPFVRKGYGIIWKMKEDLSGPYPGYSYGGLDPFKGYVIYRLLDAGREILTEEIKDMKEIVEQSYHYSDTDQDLGAGMLVWLTHFFPNEDWAISLRKRSLDTLDKMWIDPPGYFCRTKQLRKVKFAFTNYGISLGLQAVRTWADRVNKLNLFFETYKHGDEYDMNSITHVMGCVSYFPGEFFRDEQGVQ